MADSASAISDAEIDAAIKDVTNAMQSFGGDPKRLDIFGETIKGFNAILDGGVDKYPEAAFNLKGSLADVIEAGDKMLAEN